MRLDPDLRRTWLFGPVTDVRVHDAMAQSGADGLIVDLEDFTPESRRDEARRGLVDLLARWRKAGYLVAGRINALDADGPTDLEAAMAAHPDVIAYPLATSAEQMRALEEALLHWECSENAGSLIDPALSLSNDKPVNRRLMAVQALLLEVSRLEWQGSRDSHQQFLCFVPPGQLYQCFPCCANPTETNPFRGD